MATLETKLAERVGDQPVTVGVLALQGAFAAHLSILRDLGVEACEVKTNEQLASIARSSFRAASRPRCRCCS